MPNETAGPNEMHELWQSQGGEGDPMSVDAIRQKAGNYGRIFRWRNMREYATAIFVGVIFGVTVFNAADLLMRVGFGLLIAGVLYGALHLQSRGTWRELPEELGLSNCLEYHRAELVRQRDLLRGVWRWYLGPLVPGLVVLLVAIARSFPGHPPYIGWVCTGYGVLVAWLFLYFGRLNERAARSLQQRIDELDRESSQDAG